ncbi:hypothetical protein [Paenibacillus sp. JMULE4]|uniref:hypothetical protein n=1 Tax=Paenibacillus sp. JMULE4 TaxID=2518342 RepID=UPI001575CE6A|nr:hypothetical protein [Paenibacillus sp. JMULE4]
MIRIGGEFELNTALLAKNRKENSRIIYPNKHQIWTDTGRSALFIAIDDILKKVERN